MKTFLRKLSIAACATLLISASFAATEIVITTADGTGADVYVENNKPNFGTAALVVKNASSNPPNPHVTRKAYLRFDLSALNDRLSDIEGATLSLTTSTNHIGGGATPPRAYTVLVDGLTDESADSWDENTLLWTDAPANVLTDNSLIEGETTALGLLDVPEVADPDLVTFTSTELVDFIKSDTNGVITLILRRTDLDAGNNLAFHSKESGAGSPIANILPTLRIFVGGELVEQPFELAIGGTEIGNNLYESPWLGRVVMVEENVFFSNLGWLWTGQATKPDGMWIYSWDLGAWFWTNNTAYPWIYIQGEGWVYVYYAPDSGTWLYNVSAAQWSEFNDVGWFHPQSEAERISELNTSLLSTPRPRILFTTEDLPMLREKVQEGWLAETYQDLLGDVRLIMRDPPNTTIAYGASLGRRIHIPVAKLAFAGYMEEDESFLRHAIGLALHQIDTYTIEEFVNNNPGSPHLGTGDVLHAYGIAYDWLYPYMNIIERSKMKNFLETLGTIQYDDVIGEFNGTNRISDATNHNSVSNGGLGHAALALGNKPVWVEHAINQVRRYMDFSIDATGWNFEGKGYLNYGNWGALPFVEAVRNLGGPDVFSEFPKYEDVAVNMLLRTIPAYIPGNELNYYFEPYGSGQGVQMTSLANSVYQDRVGHWLWLKTQTREALGTGSRNGDYGSEGIDFQVYTLIWGDPTLEPLSPGEAGLPLDQVYESGRVATRDGWDQDAAVLTYSTGWTAHTGHRMRSENSFNYYALGEEFSVSPPDAQTRSEIVHTSVVVGDARTDRNAGEHIYGSILEETIMDDAYVYIRGDAKDSAAYFIDEKGWENPDEQKVSEATRHIIFARSPEGIEEPYIVVMDDVTARADTEKFSWTFHTKAHNTVDLEDGSGNFTVTGANFGAMLDVDFIAPASGMTNEIVSHDNLNDNKGWFTAQEFRDYMTSISTIYNGKSVRFITILRTHEAGTTPPAYTFTGTEDDGQITVELSDGTTDVITIKDDTMTFERTAL